MCPVSQTPPSYQQDLIHEHSSTYINHAHYLVRSNISTMADAAPTSAEETLHNASHISIAQLTPLLSAPSSHSIKAVVTIIWPYSSINKTVTVGLAEPDFRLRRTRGQVRVQFTGSSARKVVESKIGSGDQFLLSLDGAEWVKRNETINTPGRDIEWELRFSERLLLEVRRLA